MSIAKKIIKDIYRVVKPAHASSYDNVKKIENYLKNGKVPWSGGYDEYKWEQISNSINDIELIEQFKRCLIPKDYGIGIDERIVEYPWLISKIPKGIGKLLDAGSTFNFNQILQSEVFNEKDIYIYTFHPEANNYAKDRISYIYGDLREVPFKNDLFDYVICHSTLEHIDMDNSMYGYQLAHQEDGFAKNYEYLKVIKELERIAKPGATILITFPYGRFENHGFFQQFDAEMVQRIEGAVASTCYSEKAFAKYDSNGWSFVTQSECDDAYSYNPHSGIGRGDDNAAHSRAICFIEILKKTDQF